MGLDSDPRKEHAQVSHQVLLALDPPIHAEVFAEAMTGQTTTMLLVALIVLFHLPHIHR